MESSILRALLAFVATALVKSGEKGGLYYAKAMAGSSLDPIVLVSGKVLCTSSSFWGAW